MRTGYAIIMALFMFSLMSNVVFEMGIFPNHDIINVGLGTATIDEINESAFGLYTTSDDVGSEEDEISLFGGIQLILKCGAVVLKSVGTTVLVYPLLTSYGIPAILATAVQGMVTLVEGFYIVEFISNRRLSQ